MRLIPVRNRIEGRTKATLAVTAMSWPYFDAFWSPIQYAVWTAVGGPVFAKLARGLRP